MSQFLPEELRAWLAADETRSARFAIRNKAGLCLYLRGETPASNHVYLESVTVLASSTIHAAIEHWHLMAERGKQ